MASIEKPLAKGERESLEETERQLAIGTDRMNVLRDKTGRVTNDMDERIVVKRVYGDLHSCNTRWGKSSAKLVSYAHEIPTVTKEVQKALKGMDRGKATGGNRITQYLLTLRMFYRKASKIIFRMPPRSGSTTGLKNANIPNSNKRVMPKSLRIIAISA